MICSDHAAPGGRGLPMEEALARALDLWRREPFCWSLSNCGLRVSAYVADRCGVDVAASWRGLSADAGTVLRVLDRRGGMVAVVGGLLEARGWAPDFEARRGSVVVAVVRGVEAVGLSVGGGRCAFSMERGVLTARAVTVRAAWCWPEDAP